MRRTEVLQGVRKMRFTMRFGVSLPVTFEVDSVADTVVFEEMTGRRTGPVRHNLFPRPGA